MSRQPAEVFHPGVHIQDELTARGWTKAHLANRMGCSPLIVKRILEGKRDIGNLTARELSAAFGTGIEFWLNLQNAYDEWVKCADCGAGEAG